MAGKYHVKIDGAGFLVVPGSYRRVADGEVSGRWQQWQQADWRGGDAETRGHGDAGSFSASPRLRVPASGARWKTGYGVEIGSAGRLSLAPALGESYASAEDGFAAMVAYGSRLYAAASASGKVYDWTGAAWALAHDTGKASLKSMARVGTRLYVGSGADGAVTSYDGAAWAVAFAAAGAAAVSAMAAYQVWAVQEGRIEAIAVYGGRLYVATSEPGNVVQGRLLAYDGREGAGEWEDAAWIPDNYVAGMARFDGLLFCGAGRLGKVWAFDGDRLVEAYDLAEQGTASPGSLRALAVVANRLYVGYNHSSASVGAALLSKLPAAVVLGGVVAVSGDGGRAELAACRLGWSTPSCVGTAGNVRSLGVYNGELYLARDAAGAATIYRRVASTLRLTGQLDLSEFDGGEPGVEKLLRSVTVAHEKLRANETVKLSASLEGSDTYQKLELFDSLAGCDVALTTADWRAQEGLVRLKGYPTQSYSGKVAGSFLACKHVAREVATSADPNPGPPSISTEFSQAKYDAVVAAGGAVAVTQTAGAGLYAHQLFVLDLAAHGYSLLKPKAVAYGKGNNGGAPVAGVTFRIWNHQTAAWDLLGANAAAPGDAEAARTITATIVAADAPKYVGADGKVYLALRSTSAGSVANPGEVGCDYVGLTGAYAANGEAVSAVALPVGGDITGATLTVLTKALPPGCNVALQMSCDGGIHWENAVDGVALVFANVGSELKWKLVLSGTGSTGPTVYAVKVDYTTGNWVEVGTSAVDAATSQTFKFQKGARARRLGVRVELGSGDTAAGPVVTGVGLEYAVASRARRRWQFEARCEGVAATPLRLLDGSAETRTGAELSRLLWSARDREVVDYEDLNGVEYRAWFRGLSESVGELRQEGGAQTVARCELVEC